MPIDQGPTAQAVAYLRALVSADPEFWPSADQTIIVNIDLIRESSATKACLLLDLSDHTTIRLDIERYNRED